MESLKKIGPMVLIAIILLFTAFTFFKIPNNLKAAISHLDEATGKIDESIVLLKQQQVFLDSVITANRALQLELAAIKMENDSLSANIKARFDNAHLYLYDILTKVKQLPEKINVPQ